MNKSKKQKKERLIEPGKKIIPSNGGGNKVRKPIENHNKFVNKWTKKSAGWSCFAIMNFCLLFILLGTIGACFYSASNGDLSAEGIQKALPILRKDMDHLINLTVNYVKARKLDKYAENVIQVVGKLWTDYFPWTLYDGLRRNLYHGIAALETYTGDLSPYSDFVVQKASGLAHLVYDIGAIILKQLQSFFSNVSVSSIFETCKSILVFSVEQFYILQEELYKNKAFVSLWEPCKNFIYEWTIVLQKYIFEMCKEAQVTWIPVLKNQTVYFFQYARQSIENIFR